MVEKSLILVKPDGVSRGLIGQVLGRFEARGLVIEQLKMLTITSDMADTHYAEHLDKPFYPSLKEYITSGPVVAAVVSGEGAIAVIRKMVGATNAAEADSGTIRGDYALTTAENIVHASDSVDSATREISIYF